MPEQRRLPIGAEIISAGKVHFRLWAPKGKSVDVALENSAEPGEARQFYALEQDERGYFSGTVEAGPGALYRFRVNQAEHLHPDPASRYQPQGPHRSSCVIDPNQFRWTDGDWPGVHLKGRVMYEMHIGTFTPEGTWGAAATQLPELARDGISLIQMMPIADFPGEFGWGYDGVDLFAPCRLYGRPDDLRAFIDRAHSLGIGVILDVVYNHLGPDGNYLRVYSDHYFSRRYATEWGDPLNFDGENSGPVREFFIANARYWIEEFHFDGFRFDATQSIFDRSGEHILAEIARNARAAAGRRSIVLVAENEPQESKLARPRERGGFGLDGLLNDDFHHSAVVALTGRNPAYYSDYAGQPQELISAIKYGYLYQGQIFSWQRKRRGRPAFDLPPASFVSFLENHDQVANSLRGDRIRTMTSPGRYRAMTALLLLAPSTPLLFQGQEFGATTPFLYFADVITDLREPVRKGRFDFLKQFPTMVNEDVQRQLPNPADVETFRRSKLQPSERDRFADIRALYRDLIKLRHHDRCFSRQEHDAVDGAVISSAAFVLRFFDSLGEDRLLVFNLGRAFRPGIVPEPLIAPPADHQWETLWSTEALRYGGPGEVPVETESGWDIPAEAAVVLRPVTLPVEE